VTKAAAIAQGAIIRSSGFKSRVPFKRREALGPFPGTTSTFAITATFVINPGLSATFPWLSSPASAFNMYRFRKLRILYKNSTNTTNTGVVVLGYNPDPNDPPPTTLAQVENYDCKVRISAWEDSYVDVPVSDLNRLEKFFVRNSIVSGDNSLYDLGAIYVCCSGNASNTATIGEIWLEYEVDMFSPIIGPTAPAARATSTYSMATTTVTTGVQILMPFITSLYNSYGLNTATGLFTGINGVVNVYAQVTLGAATLTAGALIILKNGGSVLTANYPPLLNGTSTANVFATVSLVPTDTLGIYVNATGTTLVACPTSPQNAILIINAA